MDYILIYDILKYIDLNPFTIFLNIGINISFPFLILLAIIKKQPNRKSLIYIYLLVVIFFTIIEWIEATNTNKIITKKKYSKVEGEIYNYIPSNRYKRELGSFYIKGHRFESLTSHGLLKDYKLNKVILKNGYKVKIHYDNGTILQFWIEDKALTSKENP